MSYIVVSETARAARELVAAAQAQGADQIVAVVFDDATAQEVARCGVAKVIVAAVAQGASKDGVDQVVVPLAQAAGQAVVLLSGTRRLVNASAAIAHALGTSPIVDAFKVEDGAASHMLYGGKVFVAERATGAYTVAVMQGAAYEPPADDAAAALIEQAPIEPAARVRVVELKAKESSTVDLGAAKRIVSIGRGVSTREGFELCGKLAAALGAEMACTRPVTETEDPFMPRETYIGASGIIVKPELYLGVAASGQTQHTMGMYESGKVVVINKDTSCPFFDRADYCLVGAYEDVVPALARALG